ncbi:SUF system NifU family Fe-S cluster assembly protein [Zooshikella marina]|uniref:SUF system NifU family Fe-S cluster assembly protein n=1 Tax=Zooshikella ganghwensis TaxID=202772 RepID=A0A4P9VP85_9GAMM|nr:SUF system NifU family Fe-S cluster assembly protein [Zooshikella ganghwensis]MBU2706711.1 SUF system NifU family Fe-S cluster assembly protein [Zooshikella ganghwensis]RDH43930.1 SUF system NifU family Fe-S cluster assembly protein [Zooshikella ganghwensis]
MNPELKQLYQELIMDHGRQPRNFRVLSPCTHKQQADNPLCGDQLTLYLDVKNGVVQDIAFQGHGCAISMASSSMMTQEVKGKSVDNALALFKKFHQLIMSGESAEDMGRLAVLSGVKAFPMRVKCATLAWHALEHALSANDGQAVTTE